MNAKKTGGTNDTQLVDDQTSSLDIVLPSLMLNDRITTTAQLKDVLKIVKDWPVIKAGYLSRRVVPKFASREQQNECKWKTYYAEVRGVYLLIYRVSDAETMPDEAHFTFTRDLQAFITKKTNTLLNLLQFKSKSAASSPIARYKPRGTIYQSPRRVRRVLVNYARLEDAKISIAKYKSSPNSTAKPLPSHILLKSAEDSVSFALFDPVVPRNVVRHCLDDQGLGFDALSDVETSMRLTQIQEWCMAFAVGGAIIKKAEIEECTMDQINPAASSDRNPTKSRPNSSPLKDAVVTQSKKLASGIKRVSLGTGAWISNAASSFSKKDTTEKKEKSKSTSSVMGNKRLSLSYWTAKFSTQDDSSNAPKPKKRWSVNLFPAQLALPSESKAGASERRWSKPSEWFTRTQYEQSQQVEATYRTHNEQKRQSKSSKRRSTLQQPSQEPKTHPDLHPIRTDSLALVHPKPRVRKDMVDITDPEYDHKMAHINESDSTIAMANKDHHQDISYVQANDDEGRAGYIPDWINPVRWISDAVSPTFDDSASDEESVPEKYPQSVSEESISATAKLASKPLPMSPKPKEASLKPMPNNSTSPLTLQDEQEELESPITSVAIPASESKSALVKTPESTEQEENLFDYGKPQKRVVPSSPTLHVYPTPTKSDEEAAEDLPKMDRHVKIRLEHQLSERSARSVEKIPHPVRQLIEAIEDLGLECEGVYRLSGSLTTVTKLLKQITSKRGLELKETGYTPRRFSSTTNTKRISAIKPVGYDDGEEQKDGDNSDETYTNVRRYKRQSTSLDLKRDLYKMSLFDNDVHVLASVLKTYLREGIGKKHEPICTTKLYDAFIAAGAKETHEDKLSAIQDVVHQLPDEHFATLEYLCRHLSHVASNAGVTCMTSRNLSIVFGPTLFSETTLSSTTTPTMSNNRKKPAKKGPPPNQVTIKAMHDMPIQCKLVELMVDYSNWIFEPVEYVVPLFHETSISDMSAIGDEMHGDEETAHGASGANEDMWKFDDDDDVVAPVKPPRGNRRVTSTESVEDLYWT